MTPLHAEDLPKHLRDKLRPISEETAKKLEAAEFKPLLEPAEARGKPRGHGPCYTCHGCGERFPGWTAAAERHASQPGHGRMDMEITPAAPTAR